LLNCLTVRLSGHLVRKLGTLSFLQPFFLYLRRNRDRLTPRNTDGLVWGPQDCKFDQPK
jgi:hypothetical protein